MVQIHVSLFIFAVVAEWSKARGLGPYLFGGAGSDPVDSIIQEGRGLISGCVRVVKELDLSSTGVMLRAGSNPVAHTPVP